MLKHGAASVGSDTQRIALKERQRVINYHRRFFFEDFYIRAPFPSDLRRIKNPPLVCSQLVKVFMSIILI